MKPINELDVPKPRMHVYRSSKTSTSTSASVLGSPESNEGLTMNNGMLRGTMVRRDFVKDSSGVEEAL